MCNSEIVGYLVIGGVGDGDCDLESRRLVAVVVLAFSDVHITHTVSEWQCAVHAASATGLVHL